MNWVVADDSPSLAPEDGLHVLIFKPELDMFPQIVTGKEIVQFRHMRVQTFQSSLQAISTNWSAFTVFSRGTNNQWRATPERPIEEAELRILEAIESRVKTPAAMVSPKKCVGAYRPLLRVSEIRPDLYFDLVAQVLRILPSSTSNQVNILLTDYTSNDLLTLSPGRFEQHPALEHRLLICTLWDNFVDHAARLVEGGCVKILNLRSKLLHSGDGANGGNIVAVLHGDPSGTEKIFELAADCEGAKAVLARRAQLIGNSPPNFRQPTTSGSPPEASQQAALREQHMDAHKSVLTESPIKPSLAHCRTSNAATWSASLTIFVAILHENIPFTSIRQILDCPTVPEKFLLKGRIIRHHPQEIVKFARRFCRPCQASWPDADQLHCHKCHAPNQEFAFLFALDVTDGFDEISLLICFDDAVRFLNGLVPADLRTDQATSAYLAEIMQRLTSSPIPTPFCIKSYQIGAERRHRVFDTLMNP